MTTSKIIVLFMYDISDFIAVYIKIPEYIKTLQAID